MNNRINELKKIALEKFAANHSLTVRQISPVLDQKSQQEVDMIFAKLIVMDIQRVLSDEYRHAPDSSLLGMWASMLLIEKHFPTEGE